MEGYYVLSQNDVEGRLDAHYRGLGGRPVAESFRYSSDGNENWLEPSDFLALIADQPS